MMKRQLKVLGGLVLILFVIAVLFVSIAHSGEFKLKKVNSHYEPELILSKKGIILPGTNIKAGAYEYIADNGNKVARLGFLINNKQFYFVQSDEYNFWGDTTYGIYSGYFIVDSAGYGSVGGHNHLMFLIRYDKDSVQLLDVIGKAYVNSYGMDFNLINNEKTGRYWKADIKDIDGDGNPEIKLKVSAAHGFNLYFEILNNQLRIDLNPELYMPLYENIKQKYEGKTKPKSYYVYGFIAKKLELQDIKTALLSGKDKYIITLLENIDKWDVEFHNRGKEKFELTEYNLKGR